MSANKYSKDKGVIVALFMVIVGLLLILAGNGFQALFLKIDLDNLVVNIGALLLVVGVLQWFFDTQVRYQFFKEIKEEILSNTNVSDSGISDYCANSKDVNFAEMFLTSNRVTIGLNYSAKLIDNSIELLEKRTKAKKETKIILIDSNSDAGKFLEHDNNTVNIRSRIDIIKETCRNFDDKMEYIKIIEVKTILRYSFVFFDSRVWVVMSTNGLGRRNVPGFFVRYGTSWFEHFEKDVELLEKRV